MSLLKADTKKITEKIKTMSGSTCGMLGAKRFESLKQIKNIKTGFKGLQQDQAPEDIKPSKSEITSEQRKIIDAHKEDLRTIIQFAAPFACETLAVELLERCCKELLRSVPNVQVSDTTKAD